MVVISSCDAGPAGRTHVGRSSPRILDVVARKIATRDHSCNDDAFDSLYPKYAGARPKTLTLSKRQALREITSPPNRASRAR
jgi:hypothetical protein